MNNPLHRQRIMKCGWLKKQGGMVRTWHRRWFCLNGDCLFYFAKEDDLKPLGSIFLPGNRVSEVPFNPDDSDKFLFEVFPGKGLAKMTPNHDSFLLCAATDEERQMWIKIIRKVMYSSFGGAIFGQSLEETMEYEHKKGRKIPYIIEQCVIFLQEYGLDVEGLFRLPGRTLLIKELREKLDCAEKVVFDISQVDVHTVASLLKLYFRELPQSIIPSSHYQKFMNIALHFQGAKDNEDKQNAVEELKEYVKKIPEDNFCVVAYLCKFLAKVAEHSEANKMNILNLATVFGPNIIRNVSEADSAELMMVTADITQQLAYMMIHYHEEVWGENEKSDDAKSVEVDDLLKLDFDEDEKFDDSVLLPSPANSSLLHQLSKEFEGIDFFGGGNISQDVNQNSPEESKNSSKESSPKPDLLPKPIPPQRRNKMSKILRKNRLGSDKKRDAVVSSASSTASDDLPPSQNTPGGNLSPGEKHRRMHYLETSFDHDGSINGLQNNTKDETDQGGGSQNAQTQEEWLEKQLIITKENYEKEIMRLNEKCSHLEQQQKTYQVRIAEMKTKQDRQIQDLNKNMSKITSRYENRIASMDAVHKDTVKKMEDKLKAEQKSREEAVRRVINLQAQLQQYHLHYGEIGN